MAAAVQIYRKRRRMQHLVQTLDCPSFPSPPFSCAFLGVRGLGARKISQMLVGEYYRILNPLNMHLDISLFACTFASQAAR
jgi:hypothetical protein